MKKLILLIATITGSLAVSGAGHAEEFLIKQEGKSFKPGELKIKVGDVVKFRNDDPFSHNVYSLSEAKFFDLGSYPKGESRDVTFDKPGIIEVGCAVHMDMALKIIVE